jgi:hypothetical protein
MIRQQAVIDLQQHSAEDGAYITEQQIDNYLIANHEDEEGEEERTFAAQQKYEATLKMVREASRPGSFEEARARTLANPAPVRIPPKQHDWDFFYNSLQAPRDTRRTILAKMCSGTTPVFK